MCECVCVSLCLYDHFLHRSAPQDGPKQCTEEEAHALLDQFVAAGGNFIDTANVYQAGRSEDIIGSWLHK